MQINFQFSRLPDGKEVVGVQLLGDPIFRVQTPSIDTRELLRQIKRQQPQAFRDVHYEIVTANGHEVDVSQIESQHPQPKNA